MKLITLLTLASTLFSGFAYADSFGFNAGPFRIKFHSQDRHYKRSSDGRYYRARNGRYYHESDRHYYQRNDPRYIYYDEYRYSPELVNYSAIRTVVDTPICRAISNQRRLEIFVDGIEEVSSSQKKIVSKKITVEPYAFGVTQDGSPVLHGNIVREDMVKEEIIDSDNERFNEASESPKEKGQSFFADLFTSNENKNIDISNVIKIKVIEDSHFDVPSGYEEMDDPNVETICEIPLSE